MQNRILTLSINLMRPKGSKILQRQKGRHMQRIYMNNSLILLYYFYYIIFRTFVNACNNCFVRQTFRFHDNRESCGALILSRVQAGNLTNASALMNSKRAH